MGVSILEDGVWREETNDSSVTRYDPTKPEMGERPREDREQERQRLPFVPGVAPGLQEITPTREEEKRHEWHPGLIKTPVAPARPKTKPPILH